MQKSRVEATGPSLFSVYLLLVFNLALSCAHSMIFMNIFCSLFIPEKRRQEMKKEGHFKDVKMHYFNLLGVSVDIYQVPEFCVERAKKAKNLVCPRRQLKGTIKAGEKLLIPSVCVVDNVHNIYLLLSIIFMI